MQLDLARKPLNDALGHFCEMLGAIPPGRGTSKTYGAKPSR
jgi:hypothetical protein